MASHFRQTGERAPIRDGETSPALPMMGRHARRPATPHGTSASVTGAFQRLDPSVTGSFAAIPDASLQPIRVPASANDSAPRPIGVDPSVTGSFTRITPEMATRSAARESASEAPRSARPRRAGGDGRRRRPYGRRSSSSHPAVAPIDGRTAAIVAAVAVLLVAVVGIALRGNVAGHEDQDDAGGTPVSQVAPTEPIDYVGSTYELVDNGDGTHTLTAHAEGGTTGVGVALVNGDPAQIVTYNGSIIIPESYADGTWDVIAYTPGGDALATQVIDAHGEPVHGSGTITEVHLDGDTLVIVDSTGATTSTSLVG